MSLEDFAPTASWANLRLRAELLRRLRHFFETRGFLEVETPLLSGDTVVDLHLDPIPVTLPTDAREPNVGRAMWLQTSPEFGMKRLLAAGAEAIYQITRALRSGEAGATHNPEFTIIEWYRTGDDMQAGIQFLSDLCSQMLNLGPAEQLTYAEAFARFVGIDPHTADSKTLQRVAAEKTKSEPVGLDSNDRDNWLNLLLSQCIEPQLGKDRPTILYDFPATQAALARIRDGDPAVAERFELYVSGVELANGYHELLDANELLCRNKQANEQRAADGKPRLPEQSRLLVAMQHGLPPCTGVALGFDRLVMIAAGADNIAKVMAFPIDRA